MHFSIAVAAGLCSATALAFQGTSPFVLLSTSELPNVPQKQIVSSEQINKQLSESLNGCSSDVYILVSQPGVSAEDFEDPNASIHLSRRVRGSDAAVKSSLVVPEVLGAGLDVATAKSLLVKSCGVKQTSHLDVETGVIDYPNDFPQLLQLDLPSLPTTGEKRRSKLADHDSFINAAIKSLGSRSYTLIYHATPPSPAVLRNLASEPTSINIDLGPGSPEAVHMDLKRDFRSHNRKRQDDPKYDPALFEKYNFLSPGIFMGGLIVIILFSIGSVGVTWLASVQVSYAAFSKEMGPAAQKKAQ